MTVDANYFQDVVRFHRAAGIEGPDEPQVLAGELPEGLGDHCFEISKQLKSDGSGERAFRLAMMFEELGEYILALEDGDAVGCFDGLLDLIYFAVGTADHHGFPLNQGWEAVHGANMAKVRNGVVLDEHGKIQKPPGWEAPEFKLAKILNRARRGEVVEEPEVLTIDDVEFTTDTPEPEAPEIEDSKGPGLWGKW